MLCAAYKVAGYGVDYVYLMLGSDGVWDKLARQKMNRGVYMFIFSIMVHSMIAVDKQFEKRIIVPLQRAWRVYRHSTAYYKKRWVHPLAWAYKKW